MRTSLSSVLVECRSFSALPSTLSLISGQSQWLIRGLHSAGKVPAKRTKDHCLSSCNGYDQDWFDKHQPWKAQYW